MCTAWQAAAIALLMLPSVALAELPEGSKWNGEITITRTGKMNKQTDLSDRDRYGERRETRVLKDVTTFSVCGGAASDRLEISSVKRDLSDHLDVREDTRLHRSDCGLPKEAEGHNALYISKHFKRVIKEPGTSTNVQHQVIKELYSGSDAPKLRDDAYARLRETEGGYELDVSVRAYIAATEDLVTRVVSACTGNTALTEAHFRTGNIGSKPTGDRRVNGEGDAKQDIGFGQRPPVKESIGFTQIIPATKDRLSGSAEVDRTTPIEPNGYSQITVAMWNLNRRTDCQAVENQLRKDLALAAAYADRNLQESSANKKQYENSVAIRAYQETHGGQMPPQGSGSPVEDEAEGSLDPSTCMLRDMGAMLEKYQRQCLPEVVYDSEVAHEQHHQAQCKQFQQQMLAGDPRDVGKFEATAYLKGAQMLLEWLKKHCTGDYTWAEQKMELVRNRLVQR